MAINHAEESIERIVIAYYPFVQGIYLFGSYQTENEWPTSDVDIALLFPYDLAKRERGLALSECRGRLEETLRKNIDLVNVRLVSTVFQFQIVSAGRLVYVGDANAVDEFEMLTFSYYQKLNEERRFILQEFYKTKRAYRV
ncbi:MAG: nucleotidyltransferase domain-containing protein [Candidatus Omnitrophota bacterium]|nr:MAG: nucleotidyltransferase domain-containing protein [Candidatus Omnitrophota bacterium]